VSFVGELQRRNVIRVAVAFVVAGWVITQVLQVAAEVFGAPAWVMQMFVALLAIGFIPTLVFSWAYELTPEGLKRESEITQDQSIAAHTAKKLDIAVIILLIAAIALPFLRPASGPGEPDVVADAAIDAATPTEDSQGLDQDSAIAVLPFADLSPNGDQGYFADGISEEILNLLAKQAELRVIARTSAFQFREAVDLREVGAALNADRILEGSVRTAGTRVRITAQLIDAETGLHLWSETYDRELNDIFAVQDEIAGAITDALGVHLGVTPAGEEIQANPEAYRLYLRGRQALAERLAPGRLNDSIELLQRAVDTDSSMTAARGALALAWSLRSGYDTSMSQSEAFTRSVEIADATLLADPDNVDAMLARSYAHSQMGFELTESQRVIQRALSLRPNDVWTNNFAGDFYRIIGDADRALRHDGLAALLDPLDPVQQTDLAWTLIFDQQFEQALAHARRALVLQPDGLFSIDAEVNALIFLGRLEEAEARITSMQAAGDYSDDLAEFARLMIAIARDDQAAIASARDASIAAGATTNLEATQQTLVAFLVGDLETTREWLLEAVAREDSVWAYNMLGFTMFDRLEAAGLAVDLPQFAELRARRADSRWRETDWIGLLRAAGRQGQ
jgi:TolB-like protein/Tfp pilus assembly protein PilF